MQIRVTKVRRTASGENAQAWRDALSAPGWAEGATVLKEDAGSWVRRATLLGRDVVVKCRPLNTIGRRFKHAIGMGHGDKHWRGAERLAKTRIATGKPLALLRAEVDARACELLALEYVAGENLLSVLDSIARGTGPNVKNQHAIARAVGDSVFRMILGGFWNRDHKPSNLIVIRNGCDAPRIAVIDCVAIRRWPWMGMLDDEDALETMFATLMIEPTGCGCAPRRSLSARAIMAARSFQPGTDKRPRLSRSRATIEQIGSMIDEHGDPRPRVNPLAENRQSTR